MRRFRLETPINPAAIARCLFIAIALLKKRVLNAQGLSLLALLCLPIGAVMGGDLSVDGKVEANEVTTGEVNADQVFGTEFFGDGSGLTNLPSDPELTVVQQSICELYFTLETSQYGVLAPNFCTPFAIGDIGPAGGLVFHVGAFGLSGLEAATADLPGTYVWGCSGTDLPGAAGTAVGTGEQNTMDIVAGCVERPIAASAAADYSQGGYTDYFLPSIDELTLMFTNLHNQSPSLGGFTDNDYWSSSEFADILAYAQKFFGNGGQVIGLKNDPKMLRAVREF